MRVRTRSDGPHTVTHKTYGDGVLVSSADYIVSSSSERMEDVVIPGFHKRVKNGELFNNPCSYEKEEISQSGGSGMLVTCGDVEPNLTVYSANGGSMTQEVGKWDCGVNSISELFAIDDPAFNYEQHVDRAKQSALANIDTSPFEFGEDVGEVRETIKFLRRPLGSLFDLAKSFRKDRRKYLSAHRAKNVAQATADVWLSYRFAASPLVRSSLDAMEAYNEWQKKKKSEDHTRLTSRGYSIYSNKIEDRVTIDGYAGIDRKLNMKYTVRAGILHQVKNPVRDLRFHLGLRNKDIPETIWQLMPYSFMVDRVSDISNAIRGTTNLLDPNVKITFGWIVMKLDRQYECTGYKTYPPNIDCSGSFVFDTMKKNHFHYNRVPWDPGISDVIPDFQPGRLVNDIISTADLAALVLKQFK